MDEHVENRAHPRFEILAQVQVTRESDVYIMSTKNISRGGMFIIGDPADYPDIEVNTQVELLVFNADDPDDVDVTLNAIVVRVNDRPPAGFGLQFVNIGAGERENLVQLMGAI